MADNMRDYAGFKWHRGDFGRTPGDIVRCPVASGYSGSINGGSTIDLNIGDPVRRLADGTVAHAAGNEGASGGQDIYGVVQSIEPYWDGSKRVPGSRLPAGTTYGSILERQSAVLVVPVAGQVFEIEVDDITTATTESGYQALVGNNADHRLTTGTEPKTNCLLDISTAGTATAQWRIIGISRNIKNQDFSGAYVKLLVVCNEVQQAPFTTTGI